MENNTQEGVKKKNDVMKGCITMIILAAIIFFLFKSCSTEKMEGVSVKMPPAQIVLVNNGDETYKNGTVTINDKYKSNFEILQSKGNYTIGLLNFSDAEGNRFNLSMVVHKIYVKAENSKEERVSELFEID